MRGKSISVAIGASLLMISCGSPIMLKQENKPEIKADSEKATLVIYRATSFGFAIPINNFVDNKFVGQTKGKSYFITKVDPGEHYIIGDAENDACAKINFQAGKVYYLNQGIFPGVMKARTGFIGSDPESFEKEVKEMTFCTVAPDQELPVNDEEDYKETVSDHEKELKEDPDKHKDTSNIQGY